ncbi:MAG: asparagine synthase-related protein, partial [bacterium]
MPGIFGAIDPVRQHDWERLGQNVLALLGHQPWYGTALRTEDTACLGAVATSPHFAAERYFATNERCSLIVEGHALAVDGESLDPRTEVAARLLDLYTKAGDAFIERVTGFFNLAIHHRHESGLTVFNDRIAYGHLYYYHDGDFLLFAPEVKAFLAHPRLDKSLDEAGVAYFLAGHEGMIGDRTYLQKAKILPAAAKLEYRNGKVTVSRYWRAEFRPDVTLNPDDIIDCCLDRYRRSLQARLPAESYERIVVPLSGGLDSRLLTRLLCDQGRSPAELSLYTHGKPDSLDYRLARKVAAKLGLSDRHRLLEVHPDWLGENALKSVWLTDGQFIFSNAYLIGINEQLGPGRFPFVNGFIGSYLSLSARVTADDLLPLTDRAGLADRVVAALSLPIGHAMLRFFLRDEV